LEIISTFEDKRRVFACDRAEVWTNALTRIGRRIASLDPLEGILNYIVSVAVHLLDCDAAVLGLWDVECQGLIIKAFAPSELAPQVNTLWGGIIYDAAKEARPRIITKEKCWDCPMLGKEIKTGAMTPLILDGESLGALWVVRLRRDPFREEDLSRLESLSDQAVIALQHALMAAQLQSLAVIEERARIAREMHDGLAQILGFLSLEMQALETLMHQEKYQNVMEELVVARRRIDEAHHELRENIISLRTTLSNHEGLLLALDDFLSEFSIQTGIEAQVVSRCPQNQIPISPLAETQLVRIIQEALANVRKHASASHVELEISVCDGWLKVAILDNGKGFIVAERDRHFGLQTMCERAQSVGGELDISSDNGNGTRVEIRIPLVDHYAEVEDPLMQVWR
jgi:nitrate/nitrite-specific signal transduction histidine kinase